MTNPNCRSLAEDAVGNLWIGTGNGLLRKTGNKFKRFDAADGARVVDSPVLSPSSNGGVWAAGNGRIDLLRGDSVIHCFPRPGLEGSLGIVHSLVEVDGMLWVGSQQGLHRFRLGPSGLLESALKVEYPELAVTALSTGEDGSAWSLMASPDETASSGASGLALGHFSRGRWAKEPDPARWDCRWVWNRCSLARDQFGALWLPGSGDGIQRYVNGEMQSLTMAQGEGAILCLCATADREGNLWIGTDQHGLFCWTPRKVGVYTVRDGLPHDNIWTMFEGADGGVWVGTDGGLSRFKDERFTNFTRADGSLQKDIRSVVEDREGGVWVGTMRSLERFRDGQFSPVTLPGEWEESKIRVLHPARDGAIWAGTVRGLTRVARGQLTKFTVADGLGAEEVRAILESKSGDLWVGTFGGGLSLLHRGLWTTFTTTNGLPNNCVWALHEDAEGVLWIGTENGLCRLEQGQFVSFSVREGLPTAEVNFLIEDDSERIWVGHDHGIYWVRKQELNEVARKQRTSVTAVAYDTTDGLLALETNGQKSNPTACKTRDGRLWVPTTLGLAVFNPEKVARDSVPPVAFLESIRANGQVVFSTDPAPAGSTSPSLSSQWRETELRLAPGRARVLEFRYTANTFVAPEKARFRYRMRGLDRHWIEAGARREAYFTDLHPGTYRFEVIACNHHGVWQEQGTPVLLHLAPFYYETWWFYLSVGSAAAFLLALLVTWRVRELRRIHQLQQVNALNEQRRQIARDIHDELGASLTHILQLSGQAPESGALPEPCDSRTGRIASIAEQAVDHISEIVWANNPEYDTLEDLIAYLREYAGNFFAETAVRIHFDFPETVPVRQVTGPFRRHVLMVAKEALQNVMKHASASQVWISLKLENESLGLWIRDDGFGIPRGEKPSSGDGLLNMEHRVAELRGSFDIDSRAGEGTEIRVRVPLEML